MTSNNIKQLSLKSLLILVFTPAILCVGAYTLVAMLHQSIPPFLSFMVIILLLLVPCEIGIMLYYSKKEFGKPGIQCAWVEHQSLSAGKVIIIAIPFIVFAAIVFTVIAPLEHGLLFSTIFKNVPEYYKLSYFAESYMNYPKSMVIIALVLYALGNGILAPIVEELYFRGFLMPRISRYGNWAPVIITVLFSVYHLFSPWENFTRILAILPFTYCVYKKKNIIIGMVVHCTLNMASVIMTIMSLNL
ncbi:CPBP family intramembrane metalloprotease [Lachnospiraceae bacterium MD1]|uniref:CPBP family intramembrane metalloprotease n=1 Tax=Variimorphobacter saccharofermentans TaxID=2755051 RepID=A0A839K708_9FIRM|nr:CPBP family intramembrane glutamic endopeptidase [Variimorphobacter saccharofermentans]MBB2184441.1 CPBP family intramembrane metalloprotease [Variimorphobacter saccharofermentans]